MLLVHPWITRVLSQISLKYLNNVDLNSANFLWSPRSTCTFRNPDINLISIFNIPISPMSILVKLTFLAMIRYNSILIRITVFLSCWLGLICNISWYQCNFSLQNFPGLNVLLCISLLLSSINVNISVWCGWCGNYLPFTLQTLGNFKIFVMFSLTPHYKFSSHKRQHFILTVAVSSSVLLFWQKEKMSSLIVLTIIYCIAIEVEIFAVDMFQKCRNC